MAWRNCLIWLAIWPWCAALAQTGAAAAPHRVALVVGNGQYAGSPLKNPANDARAVASALARMGFEVASHTDLGQKDLNRAITRFGAQLRDNSVALFYYAGHGMQVNGKNYLVPVDAQIANEGSVRSESVDVDSVLDQFQASGSGLNIVVLDACRNNPFEHRWRGAGGGLAQMDAPKGTLIAYATAPGRVALDGEGDHGLYTAELLKALATPGLRVEDVFKRVRVAVAAATGDQQMPWEASSLTGDFYFMPDGVSPRLTLPAPAASAEQAAAPSAPDIQLLQGIASIDKAAFLADARVVARLRALGIALNFETDNSRRVATLADPARHEFAFVTGGALAADLGRRRAARRGVIPFQTPVALASWQPVAALLADNDVVSQDANGVYTVNMRQLARWVGEGRRWQSLRHAERFPSTLPIRIASADPKASATAATYLALNAFLANDDDEIDSDAEVARVTPRIAPLFAHLGLQEDNSVDTFNDYLELGMGAMPLAVVDEARFVARLLAGGAPAAGAPVLLYPRPGMFIRHVWLPWSAAAEQVGRLLREDALLQQLAGEHGFRTGRDAGLVQRWRAQGLSAAEQFIEMANPPSFEYLEKLVAGVRPMTEK